MHPNFRSPSDLTLKCQWRQLSKGTKIMTKMIAPCLTVWSEILYRSLYRTQKPRVKWVWMSGFYSPLEWITFLRSGNYSFCGVFYFPIMWIGIFGRCMEYGTEFHASIFNSAVHFWRYCVASDTKLMKNLFYMCWKEKKPGIHNFFRKGLKRLFFLISACI